ncbi:MAG: hypothetical protein HQL58_04445 [Magnetococcales bacterium]|nr:hypothetical protein [Magnetococcales bacterium]
MRCYSLGRLLPGLVMAFLGPSHGYGQDRCANCHGWRKPVMEQRQLAAPHEGVRLTHGGDVGLWCFDCHHSQTPSMLKGPGGQSVPLDQAGQQCRVCHGRQDRDWQFGVHGKRLSCSLCHDPHQPRFAPLTPSPPPARPRGMP